MSYVAVLEKERPTVGRLLRFHKENISKSIASILILNTIAMGAGDAETANRWLEDELYGRIDYDRECYLDREKDNYPEELEVV